MEHPPGVTAALAPELAAAVRAVRLLILDVDGVLTDGRVTYTDAGHEIKSFHVRDGSAIKFWQQSGREVAIISGRESPAVDRRASELGITVVVQGVRDKAVALKAVLDQFQIDPAHVCAIGDDLPDYPVLRTCGVGVAVADACDELKAVAKYVTRTPGGHGAVREAIEWLMAAQGTWAAVLGQFGAGDG